MSNEALRRNLNFSPGIRSKVLLLSTVLLALPWLGYAYVNEMEKFFRLGQEKTVAGTAYAIATALHDRPKLFDLQAEGTSSWKEEGDMYLRTLPAPIELDGLASDWLKSSIKPHVYAAESLLQSQGEYTPASLSFKLRMGQQGKYLYALFEVTDDQVIYRVSDNAPVDQGDHLQIALVSPGGEFRRYALAPSKAGWLRAQRLQAEPSGLSVAESESRIKGFWLKTATGYALEISMPLSMIGSKLGFAVADVDNPESFETVAIIGTSGVSNAQELGSLLIPSPDIEQIVAGLARSNSRIRVIDRNRRVLAQAGSLKHAEISQAAAREAGPQSALGDIWSSVEETLLHPLYARILKQPTDDFSDDTSHATRLEGKELDGALSGIPSTTRKRTADARAVIVSAAHPVWVNNEVMGAVVVEETTNAIVTIKNRAVEKLFIVVLGVFLFGTLTLFLFASRLSSRIRRLRDEAEAAIDAHGRVQGVIASSSAGDEIGDLSRSFSNILEKLGEHTSYVENMASRLSHELRTPIAVVRSSLDNLKMQPLPGEAAIYMERAQDGLARLNTLLTRMSEASRLEHVLQHSELELFDLRQVVSGCVAGYQAIYAPHVFDLKLPAAPLMIQGAPDLIAQMLDKLVANAVDFCKEGHPILIELTHERNLAVLRVTNGGPALPQEMQDRLFQSMVSIRPHKDESGPHLGFGLYIARLIVEFHHGVISAANLPNGEGVVMTVELPMANEQMNEPKQKGA